MAEFAENEIPQPTTGCGDAGQKWARGVELFLEGKGNPATGLCEAGCLPQPLVSEQPCGLVGWSCGIFAHCVKLFCCDSCNKELNGQVLGRRELVGFPGRKPK